MKILLMQKYTFRLYPSRLIRRLMDGVILHIEFLLQKNRNTLYHEHQRLPRYFERY